MFQRHDEHHTARHHQHTADTEHGEVLEGPARDLRDAQAGGGAHPQLAVQEAHDHRGCRVSALAAAQESG